jgi:adenosine deaminase
MADSKRFENPFTSLGKQFIADLQATVQAVLINKGVDKNSDIVKSVEFTADNSRDSLFMYVKDYYEALSKGRKPGTRKIPIQDLISWIRKKNIRSNNKYTDINRLAFVIQNSIYKQGIKGKNFIKAVEDSVLDTAEPPLAEELSEFVADSLYAAFVVND